MRFGLLWVGRTRDRNIQAAIDVYLERIGRYVPVDVMEVKEGRAAGRRFEAETLGRECQRLRERIPPGHEVVVMDEGGVAMSSMEFAGFLKERLNHTSSKKGLTFVFGGHLGLDEETRRIADHTLSLSRMTLTHEMARLVAVEQIYRGLSILHGTRYHRP